MYKIYVKDPIPPPKDNEEDKVPDRLAPGNMAWSIGYYYLSHKYKLVTVRILNKVQSVVIVHTDENIDLVSLLPKRYMDWVCKEEKI